MKENLRVCNLYRRIVHLHKRCIRAFLNSSSGEELKMKGQIKRDERSEGGNHKKKRNKSKRWECVVPLIRTWESDLFGLISHLRLSLSLFFLSAPSPLFSPYVSPLQSVQFSPSHPPLSLCHTCIHLSLFLTLSFSYPAVFHQQKNFSRSVWSAACQASLWIHTRTSRYSYNASIQPRE